MIVEQITNASEAEKYILNIPKFTTKHSMEETKQFLDKLGPVLDGVPIIHVAGTNGKGSVCAYMNSILTKAGYRVGMFTSPHLVDIRERFVFQGQMISADDFTALTRKVLEYVEEPEKYHPTYFEFLFFIAVLWYGKIKPDVLLLETGLGGRLDATNSLEQKEMAVITRISRDHVEYLGDTLTQIASEKAGIMRANTPCFFNALVPEATAVFEKEGKRLGAALNPVDEEVFCLRKIKNQGIDFSIFTRYYKRVSLRISSTAVYQMENAALSVRAAEEFDYNHKRSLSAALIAQGVEECHWRGRFDQILPNVFFDGAHNADGIRAFLQSVASDGFRGRRFLIFSAVSDKEYKEMIRQIVSADLFSDIFIVQLHTQRGLEKDVLAQVFSQYPSQHYEVCQDATLALEELLKRQNGERIYVAGSLYLVGELMEHFKND